MFLQSDILRAAEDMRDAIEEAAADAFQLAPQHAAGEGAVFLAYGGGAPRALHDGAHAAGGEAGTAAAGEAAAAAAAAGPDPPSTWEASWGDAGGSEEGDEEEDGDPFVSQWAAGGWLRDNPVGVPTEREYYVAATQGAPVYRVLLVKR